LQQAALAGMYTDAYMYVSGFDVTTGARQANDVLKAIVDLPVARVWIDVEGVGSSWAQGTTPDLRAKNRRLFEDIVGTFQNNTVAVGLYTQGWQHDAIFGSGYTFAHDNSIPIWFPVYGSEPKDASGKGIGADTSDGHCQFRGTDPDTTRNWSNFGGNTVGLIKQYNGNCVKCGCGIDVNNKAPAAATAGANGGGSAPASTCGDFSADPDLGCGSVGMTAITGQDATACTQDSGTATSCETVCCQASTTSRADSLAHGDSTVASNDTPDQGEAVGY